MDEFFNQILRLPVTLLCIHLFKCRCRKCCELKVLDSQSKLRWELRGQPAIHMNTPKLVLPKDDEEEFGMVDKRD